MQVRKKLGERGQVVIPKDIRERFGLRPGSEVIFEVRENEIVIRPAVDPVMFIERFCSTPRKLEKEIDIKKLIEEEIEEEYDVLR